MSSPPESLPTSTVRTTTTTKRADDPIRSKLLHRLGIYDAVAVANTMNNKKKLSSSSSSQQQQQYHYHQPPMTAAQHRRLRILRGMGVGGHTPAAGGLYYASPPDGSAVRLPLDGLQPFQEKLKVDYDDDDEDDDVVFDNNVATMAADDTSNSSSSAELRVGSSDTEASSHTTTTTNTTTATTRKKQHRRAGSSSRKIAFQDQVQVMPIPTRYEYSDRIKSRIWSNRHELQENAERNALEFAAEGWNWRTVTEDDGMFICSESGELVHPIHLQHLMQQQQQQQQGEEEEGEEQKTGLERGSPVH